MKACLLSLLLVLAGCASVSITRCELQPTPEMMPGPEPPNSQHCHEHCAGRMWDTCDATYTCLNDDCSDWRQSADHIPTPVFPWCTLDGCEFLDVVTHHRSSIGAACIDTPTCTQWEWMDAYGIWLCDANGCTRKALPPDSKAGQGAVVPGWEGVMRERRSYAPLIVVSALLIGSSAFDIATTSAVRSRLGPAVREANPLMRNLAIGSAISFSINIALIYHAYRNYQAGDPLWWSLPVGSSMVHTAAALHNNSLGRK